MSFQVLRSESYTVGALHGLGYEAERTEEKYQKNKDIEESLTHLNYFYKRSARGFYQDWKQTLKDLGISSKIRKTSKAVVGFIITSDEDFFKSLGWRPGMGMTPKVQAFFNAAYDWIKTEYGFQGDKNIISAAVHFDEKVPHFHVFLAPVVDRWKEKVYQRGPDGKILRNVAGSPLTVTDADGHTVYKEVSGAPRLNRSEFFNQRGGRDSYRYMQDKFYDSVAKNFKLERGEVGSDRRHTSKQEYDKLRAAEITAAVSHVSALSGVSIPFFNRSLISKKDLMLLKSDARQYRINRDNILNLSEQLDKVRSREKSISKAARDVKHSEQAIKDEYEWIEREKSRLADKQRRVEKLQVEYQTLIAGIDEQVERRFEHEREKLMNKNFELQKKQMELEQFDENSVFEKRLNSVIAERDAAITERDAVIAERDEARSAAVDLKDSYAKLVSEHRSLMRTYMNMRNDYDLVCTTYSNMLNDYNKMKAQFIENDKNLNLTAKELTAVYSTLQRVQELETFVKSAAPDVYENFINRGKGIVD